MYNVLRLLTKFVCVLVLFICCIPSYAYKKGNKGKILYISSYSSDSYYIQDDILSLVNHDTGQENTYMQVLESMDCKSLNEAKEWQQTMRDILKKHNQITAVVLFGNEAAITYFSLSEDFYKEIPLYVLQCNSKLACLPASSGISSVVRDERSSCNAVDIMKGFNVRYAELTEYGVRENIELIERLYGHTRDIAILTDNSYSGLCMQYAVKEEVKYNFDKWKFHYIDGRALNMQQALDKVQQLPLHTVMLLGCWGIDKDNVSYLSNAVYAFRQATPLLPVFSFSGAGLGYWVIGGYIPQSSRKRDDLVSFFYADLDENYVKSSSHIYTPPSSFIFDEAVLRALQISREELPFSSNYLNGEMSFKDLFLYYKWYIILIICVVILLFFITSGSVMYSIHISRLRNNLLLSEQSLKQEKENLELSEHRLRIAKERAEEASRAKVNFVSNMSHEIRTPLNSIVGFSQVLSEVVKDQPELREYANIIYNNSETLVKLIDGLLEISDIESGKVQFVYDNIDIIMLLNGVVESVSVQAKEGVKMFFESECSSLEITTDVNRLLQVVMSLLKNACEHTDKGSITLSVEKDPANLMTLISVTDTGAGIPQELQHMIFDRFEKVNEFMQGAGMGLTICQSIVEQLGGKIWLDDEYVEGTRFVFSVPLDT